MIVFPWPIGGGGSIPPTGRGERAAYNGTRTETEMGTETMTDAQRVAADHADTLQRFGGWLEMFGGGASRRDVEIVAEDENEYLDRWQAARDALAWMDENGADDLSWPAFLANVLDIEIFGRFESGEWFVTGAAALISYGGPNVRYHVHAAGVIRVSVAWWNDHADRVIGSGLADYLNDYAEAVTS